jgi:hypothetical protein
MKLLTLYFLLFFSLAALGQQQKRVAFKKSAYPASKFLVTTDTSFFGGIQIITAMVTHKGRSSAGFLCRSWLIIKKSDRILKQKFYDIEPVGGCSGLFSPSKQPLEDYFIISKFGDYEGETLLIDTSGKLIELIGGSFLISTDRKHLFSIWNSDLTGITVYDLVNRKIILSKEVEGYHEYRDIYFQSGNYYVSYYEDVAVGQIDFDAKKIISTNRTQGFLKKVNKLKTYNDVQSLPKCNCGGR